MSIESVPEQLGTMWSRSFGDGVGSNRVHFCHKVHGFHQGLHCYASRSLGPNRNEITKYAWLAGHWVLEDIFVRIKTSPYDLVDYDPRSYEKLLQGKVCRPKRIHHIIYRGPHYIPSWGLHTLTFSREILPGPAGVGSKSRTAWAHESEQFGEYCYSASDGAQGIRVLRYSAV